MTTAPAAGRLRAAAEFAVAAAIALGVLVAVTQTRADVDLFGHVRFGRDFLQHGRLDRTDPYSFTSDRSWVNHEWLAEVLFAAAWQWGGNAGLIAVKASCITGTLLLLWATLRRRLVPGRTRVTLVALALAGILPRVTHVRPQLFSVLLFSALWFILYGAREPTPSNRRLFWMAPLFALWANLHGGWLVGLATLGLWILGLAWHRRHHFPGAALPIAIGALGLVSTLLNPYGIGLWNFLAETVRFGRKSVTEWGPLWSDPALLLIWILFACLAAWGLTHRGVREQEPENRITKWIPVLWGLAALRVSRLDSFFVLSAIAAMGPRLQSLFPSRARPHAVDLPGTARISIAAVLIALAAAIPRARQSMSCVEMYGPWWPEPQAIAFMKTRNITGNMVTFFRWGEYGIWNLPSTVRVSMDGRRETVYTDRVVDGHLELYDGTDVGLAYLRELNADFVWFPTFLPVTAKLQHDGWPTLFEGPVSALLARPSGFDSGAGFPEKIVDVPRSRCFPGP
jgi:hypothetical protein